jgi:hypothetical protein
MSLQLDSSKPCFFFDGASMRNLYECGVGGVLYLLEINYVYFTCSLVYGSNNMVEIKTLLILVWFVVKSDI